MLNVQEEKAKHLNYHTWKRERERGRDVTIIKETTKNSQSVDFQYKTT